MRRPAIIAALALAVLGGAAVWARSDGGSWTGVWFALTDPASWARYAAAASEPVSQIDDPNPKEWVAEQGPAPVEVATPEAAGIDRSALDAAEAYAAEMGSYALIVGRDGRVVRETYWEGFGPERMANSQSMHKPLLPILTGIAIADGAIASIDDPISKYLPVWRDDPRGAITIRNILYSEDGLDEAPFAESPFNLARQGFITSNIDRLAYGQQLIDEPGSVFAFHYFGTQLLGMVIEAATGQRYADYLGAKLWQPLDAGPARVRLDRENGRAQLFCCIDATARGWFKIGQLLLDQGRAPDGTQLVPADWVTALTTPSRVPHFAMQIWLGSPFTGTRPSSERPGVRAAKVSAPYLADDVRFFEGRGGQRVYIVPSRGLVVVRQGQVRYDWDDAKFLNLILAGTSDPQPQGPPPLAKVVVPTVPFDPAIAPEAPNYANKSAWAARPDMADQADLSPEGFTDNQATAPADVFWVHPTTMRAGPGWNQAMDDAVANAETDLVIKGQASAFNGCCAIWAPRYRQAHIAALGSPATLAAYDIAFADVRAAFEAFLAATGDRPILIAGHSQGALHTQRLLAAYKDDPRFADRLVGAYVIGIPMPLALYSSDLKGLSPCETATDQRCIASWASFGPTADLAAVAARTRGRHAAQMQAAGTDALQCYNPAEAMIGPMAVLPTVAGAALPAPVSVAAPACRDGSLVFPTPVPAAFAPLRLDGDSLHMLDVAMVYLGLRADATARVAAHLAANGGPTLP